MTLSKRQEQPPVSILWKAVTGVSESLTNRRYTGTRSTSRAALENVSKSGRYCIVLIVFRVSVLDWRPVCSQAIHTTIPKRTRIANGILANYPLSILGIVILIVKVWKEHPDLTVSAMSHSRIARSLVDIDSPQSGARILLPSRCWPLGYGLKPFMSRMICCWAP